MWGAMLLALASGAVSIAGQSVQGRYERERAALETARANQQIGWQQEQIGWQQDDLGRQKDAAVGSLLTHSYALGIGGPSVSQGMGTAVGEFNRAISRMETQKDWTNIQKGWNEDDLASFQKQSRINQWLGIGGSLLTTGANVYGMGLEGNYWGSKDSWWKTDRTDKGYRSFFSWEG